MGDGARARTVSQHLEHDSGAGVVARELVLEFLADQPTTDELRHNAALVAYELVANAVAHGRPDGDGTIELTYESTTMRWSCRSATLGGTARSSRGRWSPRSVTVAAWPSSTP